MPGDEQALAIHPDVRTSKPLLILHVSFVLVAGKNLAEKKSRDESRLSRLDSLRHKI